MTPTDTYNAQCDYSEITKGVRNHKNLAVTDECLLLYGNGDGGGGPTPRMLEKVGTHMTSPNSSGLTNTAPKAQRGRRAKSRGAIGESRATRSFLRHDMRKD